MPETGREARDRKLARLPDEVKRRIVVELASFRSTREVSAMLREEYGIEQSPSALCNWDPMRPYSRMSQALRELFLRTRCAYVQEAVQLNTAHQAFRLRRLEKLSFAAEAEGDLARAAALIEQGARDHGGAYTDYRRLESVRRHFPTTWGEVLARAEAWLAAQEAERDGGEK